MKIGTVLEAVERAWARVEQVYGRDVVLAYLLAALVYFPLKWAFGPAVGWAYGLLWLLGVLLIRYLLRRDGQA